MREKNKTATLESNLIDNYDVDSTLCINCLIVINKWIYLLQN